MFTIALAEAIANGSLIGDWRAPKKRYVYILDAEMTPIEIDQRVPLTVDDEYLFYTTIDLLERMGRGAWKLGDPLDNELFCNSGAAFDVLIVDNIEYTLEPAEGRDIWHPETWRRVETLTRWAKAHNKLLIFVDHLNKDGGVQGTLSKQRGASFIIKLESEYKEDSALCFMSSFTKCRYLVEPDLKRKRMWWLDDWGWHCEKEAKPKDKIIDLIKEGAIQKQIKMETGLSQGYISKIMRKNKHLNP